MAKDVDKRKYQCFLSLGSNSGDRLSSLKTAVQQLNKRVGKVNAISGIYESEAWGNSKLSHFYNLALALKTTLSPQNLLLASKKIEADMGRDLSPSIAYQDRIIDIDILFYEDWQLNEANLIVPHPVMEDRKFVLMPLLELDKSLKNSNLYEKVQDMVRHCSDNLGCKAILNQEKPELWLKNK